MEEYSLIICGTMLREVLEKSPNRISFFLHAYVPTTVHPPVPMSL